MIRMMSGMVLAHEARPLRLVDTAFGPQKYLKAGGLAIQPVNVNKKHESENKLHSLRNVPVFWFLAVHVPASLHAIFHCTDRGNVSVMATRGRPVYLTGPCGHILVIRSGHERPPVQLRLLCLLRLPLTIDLRAIIRQRPSLVSPAALWDCMAPSRNHKRHGEHLTIREFPTGSYSAKSEQDESAHC